jgi:endonuclease YncB( thermonuclease family)
LGVSAHGHHQGTLEKAAEDTQVAGGQVRRSINVVSLLIFLLGLLFASTGICIAGEYQVSRVVDGDTIIVNKGDAKTTIRLVGIDAPEISHKKYEPGQPFSQQVE